MAFENPATAQIPVAGGALPPKKNNGTLIGATKRPKESALLLLFGLCAVLTVLTTFGIIFVLFRDSLPFFREVSLFQFLFGREWAPTAAEEPSFGVLPLVSGTLLVTAGAAFFAIPMGLLSAIYLSEYASPRMRGILKPILELLAGVPTVVYGFFAFQFITPPIQALVERINGGPSVANPLITMEPFNALAASIAVAIMTLPLVSSLCEDSLRAVPASLREGAYALGATKMEVCMKVVVPAALSGIMASFILAISRAIGETMIVVLAAGQQPNLTLNPLAQIQTMTAYIVQVSQGETAQNTLPYYTIFAVGLLLFIMTVALNLASIALVRKYRHKYD